MMIKCLRLQWFVGIMLLGSVQLSALTANGAAILPLRQDVSVVDSLKEVLVKARGAERVGVLWELMLYYADRNDNVPALFYADEAYKTSQQTPVDSFLLVKAGRRFASVLRRFERFEEVFVVLEDIIPIGRRNGFDDEIDYCESLAAMIYGNQGYFDKALFYNLRCLQYRERVLDSFKMCVTLHNIGYVYLELGFPERSLLYSFRSVSIKKRIRDYYDLDISYVNIGLCYQRMGDYKKASYYFHSAFRFCYRNGDCENSLRCHIVLAELHADLGNYDSTRYYLSLGRSHSDVEDRKQLEGEYYQLLAKISNTEGKYQEAIGYLRQGEVRLLPVDAKQRLSELYVQYIKAYKGMSNYAESVRYHDKLLANSDSVFNEQIAVLLIDKELKFEQRRNRAEIDLRESILEWHRKVEIGVVVIGVLFVFLAGVLFLDFWERRRENARLEKRVKERTEELDGKVRLLERGDVVRRQWSEMMERGLREGDSRLAALQRGIKQIWIDDLEEGDPYVD